MCVIWVHGAIAVLDMVRYAWLIPLAVLLTAAQDVFQHLEEQPAQVLLALMKCHCAIRTDAVIAPPLPTPHQYWP